MELKEQKVTDTPLNDTRWLILNGIESSHQTQAGLWGLNILLILNGIERFTLRINHFFQSI